MKRKIAGFAYRFVPFAGLLTIGLVLAGSGCQKKGPSATETNAPTPAAAPNTPAAAPKQEDKVVATVNGTNIMESQVQRRIDVRYKPILARLAQQSPQLAAQQEKMLRQNIANDLVTEALLDEQAKKEGIQVTDAELTAEMNKQLSAQKPPMTIEQYQQIVEAQGGDFQAMKGFLMQSMRYHKLLEAKFADSLAVTDADAKNYYDAHPKEFEVPEEVRASHILISTKPTDPNADPNEVKAKAKQKAEELLKKVKDGADFAALAKENSDCPSAAQGGDLGTFPRGQMVKPFEDAAFAMKVGDISDLVETQFGYHIIKVTEHHDPNQTSFDEAKTEIINKLTQQKRQETIAKYVQSLRQDAKISFMSTDVPDASKAGQPVVTTAPADANAKK